MIFENLVRNSYGKKNVYHQVNYFVSFVSIRVSRTIKKMLKYVGVLVVIEGTEKLSTIKFVYFENFMQKYYKSNTKINSKKYEYQRNCGYQ